MGTFRFARAGVSVAALLLIATGCGGSDATTVSTPLTVSTDDVDAAAVDAAPSTTASVTDTASATDTASVTGEVDEAPGDELVEASTPAPDLTAPAANPVGSLDADLVERGRSTMERTISGLVIQGVDLTYEDADLSDEELACIGAIGDVASFTDALLDCLDDDSFSTIILATSAIVPND